ncbi:hypothetical protein FMM75_21430 [Lachnospiraceae bacterium MD335]|nr:hypothetical protein [Lachnospiraceae bacterium MD335]
MKKIIKTIGIIATMGIIATDSYLLCTTQAETTASLGIPEVQQTISIYDRYVVMDAAVFHDNYVDMREVVDFSVTDYGLQLYLKDGSGYYWER